MKLHNLYPLLFLGAMIATSCGQFDDLDNLEVLNDGAEYAIPLAHARTSMGELLDNFDDYTFIDVDEDGLIVLRYKGDVVTKTSDEIFASIEEALPPVPFPITDTLFELPFSSPDGIEMDYVELKSGTLTYSFQSLHEEDVIVTVKFPQTFKPNGDPLQFTHFLNYMGSTPVYMFPPVIQVDLAGHKLIADENGNLTVIYEAIRAGGQRDTLHNFFMSLSNIEFSYAEGYFGNQLHDGGRDTIEIEFFENWTRGNVYFEDPKIYINVFNSFGVPTRSIVNLFLINTVEGEVLSLESQYIEDGINFAYPTLDEVGEEKVTHFSFTKDNSNIDEVLGSNPLSIDYDVDAITNPDSITAIRGFIVDDSHYTVNVEVELPIHGRASGFAAIDTFDLDFSGYDEIKEVEFKLLAKNELPLDIGLQLYFLDEEGAVLDSLLADPQKLVKAAPIDGEGIVTGVEENVEYIPFPADRFEKIKGATRAVMNAAFSTNNNGETSVQVYIDQYLDVSIGMKLKT